MIWILGAGVANALVLHVKPQGDKGDVILRVAMSSQDYSAAQGLMGGANQVTDSDIPGMNDVNVAVPVSAQRYDRIRKNAVNDSKTAGTQWCVVCRDGKVNFTVNAETAFSAALVGTLQCQEKTKNQDLEVTGQGSCQLIGN